MKKQRLARSRRPDRKPLGTASHRMQSHGAYSRPARYDTPRPDTRLSSGISCARNNPCLASKFLILMRTRGPSALRISAVSWENSSSCTRSSYHTLNIVIPRPTSLFCLRSSLPTRSMECARRPLYSIPRSYAGNAKSTYLVPALVSTRKLSFAPDSPKPPSPLGAVISSANIDSIGELEQSSTMRPAARAFLMPRAEARASTILAIFALDRKSVV